jgi:serine/threonine protein kinase
VSARDAVTGERVAVKVCWPFSPVYRLQCFEREADVLKMLRGEPDIIQIVSDRATFEETLTSSLGGGAFTVPFSYYSLELAAHDVAGAIASGSWDAEQSLVAFRAMCRAVQRIHSKKITHRDLKPSNFLVLGSGEVRLSDFGTARQVATGVTALIHGYSGPPGDRRYCAPEMLACLHDENAHIAFTADIFALGAILFEMFSGTILGLRLFDHAFWHDIAAHMLAVKTGERQRTYDRIVGSIANARPLPSVAAFGAPVPNCVRDRIDDLYKGLSAVDYRRRLCEFDRIFNRLDTCLWIIRHEANYQRWLQERRRRRKNRAGLLSS